MQNKKVRAATLFFCAVIWTFTAFHSGYSQQRAKVFIDAKFDEGADGAELPSHDFTYDASKTLPNRLSAARDHWDFYNGATENGEGDEADLIPYYRDEFQFLPGSDRHPNADFLLVGTLEEITYPTGGSTKFYFEPHRFGKVGDVDVEREIIKKEEEYTLNGPADTTVFSEEFDVHAPVGEDVPFILEITTLEPEDVKRTPAAALP